MHRNAKQAIMFRDMFCDGSTPIPRSIDVLMIETLNFAE